MEERRAARIGTVSGLALLAGGTAVVAVAGRAHSVSATVLLGLLTVGMCHALVEEIRRQARRHSATGWAVQDTINAVLLATWSGVALAATVRAGVLGLVLSLGYGLSCAYFIIQRRRAIIARNATPPTPDPEEAITS